MIWLALTVAGLFGTLVCEYRRALKVRALFKPIASSGFVGLALVAGAFGSLFGKLVLTALVLSFVGDVVLMKRSEGAIRGGILAFGAAHVAYCAAFLERGVDPLGLGLAAAGCSFSSFFASGASSFPSFFAKNLKMEPLRDSFFVTCSSSLSSSSFEAWRGFLKMPLVMRRCASATRMATVITPSGICSNFPFVTMWSVNLPMHMAGCASCFSSE